MKANVKQKNVIFIFLIIFIASTLYLPTQDTMKGDVYQTGYCFIWQIDGEIALKTLAVEWIAILVTFLGSLFLNKDE